MAGAALRLGTEPPTADAVRDVYAKARQRGLGAENIHAVMKLFSVP